MYTDVSSLSLISLVFFFFCTVLYLYERVTIPAVIKIQSWARKLLTLDYYHRLRQQHAAASYIQQLFRRHYRRRLALKRWREAKFVFTAQNATVIQAVVRGMLARMAFQRKAMEHRARVILASRVIMRAWLNFKTTKMFQVPSIQSLIYYN
jgi:hypothetical protein